MRAFVASVFAALALSVVGVSVSCRAPERGAQPPPSAPTFDVADVVRRARFAYRAEGAKLTGGHSTYAVEIDGALVRFRSVSHARTRAVPAEPSPSPRRVPPAPTVAAPLEVETVSIARGGVESTPRAAARVAEDGHAVRAGEAASELLRNGDAGVELSWAFPRKPRGGGDLHVRLRAAGLEFVRASEGGLHFRDPASGLGVRFGHATWVDAGGARTDVPARWDGQQIALDVPSSAVEGAAYPAVLDPLIGPETAVDVPVVGPASGNQIQPSIAFSGTSYLVVWTDYRQPSLARIFGTLVSTAGAVLDADGIEISDPGIWSTNASAVWDGASYLVVYEREWDIVGRRLSAAGAPVDPASFVVSHGSHQATQPSAHAAGPTTFVAWMDARDYATEGWNVYGTRVSGATRVDGAAGIPVSRAPGDQYAPTVTYGGGSWFVAWQDWRNGSVSDVFGARISASGVPLDPAGIAISADASAQWTPSAASDGTDYFVVWSDERNAATASNDIYGARVTAGGTVLDASGIRVCGSTAWQGRPSVAFHGSHYQVVWQDGRAGIYGNRVVPSTGALADGPAGARLDGGAVAGSVEEPRILAVGSAAYVAWTRSPSDAGDDLFGSRLSATPALEDPAGVVLATSANGQAQLALASDGSGRWLVVWRDTRGSEGAIYGARVDATGVPIDTSAILLSPGVNAEDRPSVACNGTHFLVVWANPNGIYGTRVSAETGAVLDPAGLALFLRSAGNQPYEPSVASDGAGWLVTWSDSRNGPWGVYGGRVQASGAIAAADAAGIPISTGAATRYAPRAGFGGGYYFVLWTDARSGSDLYGARVDPASGAVLAETPIDTGPGWVSFFQYDVAAEGTDYWVVWADGRIKRARIASATGAVVESGDATATCCQSWPSIAWDGGTFVVVYRRSGAAGHAIDAVRLLPDGTRLDAVPLSIATDTGYPQMGPLVRSIPGASLVAYLRYDDSAGVKAERVRTRLVTGLAGGAACAFAQDCASGHCVDGVCCDSACGGSSTSDCQACSVAAGAAADGMCTVLAATRVCRPSVAGGCDVAETCNGTDRTCPADGFRPAATECRAAAGDCDLSESCTGSSAICPANAYVPAATECRAAAGVCDAAESCTGSDASCPTDAFLPAATECRAAAGVCDVAERCTGSAAACPIDAFVPAATECRAAAGDCDLSESCTGSAAACPADAFLPAATECRAAAGVCDAAESCTGSDASCPTDAFLPAATECRAAAGVCDAVESCTGSAAACPADASVPDGQACADGDPCTAHETCSAGACQGGGPALSFSPASSAFEPTTAGTTSAATTVTVTNDGEAVLTVTSVTTPAGFACLEAPPFTLAAGGGTYDLDLQFAPQRGTSGEITGSVALGTAECSFSIPVSGEALRPPSPQVASASGCGCGSGGSPAQVVPWIVALLAFGGLRRRPR